MPTLNNPSSTTLSLPRRRALVALARKHDALLLCDDVYDFLQWPTTGDHGKIPLGPLLPRLSTLDTALGPSPFDPPGTHFGHALSNGTFSKLVGPGVRTGWVHAAPDLVAGLASTGSSRSGGAPSQVAAAVVCRLVEDGGLGRHLEGVVRPGLRRRWEGMVRAVRRELEGLGEVEGGEGGLYGGYFVWVRLGEGGPGAEEVARVVRGEEGVVVAPGGLFAAGEGEGDGELDRYLRLCFSWEDEGDVEEGVKRLGRVLRGMRAGESGGERGKGEVEVGEFK